jgi:hypothetical protein
MVDFLRGRFRRDRHHHDARHRALLRGDEVVLPGKLRRTSARGWGPWTDAQLVLGALPDGEVRWRASDPTAVGFPVARGPVDERCSDVRAVLVRDVRFQTEAFFGMDSDIVVIDGDPATIEFALPPGLADPVALRIHDLVLGGLAGPSGAGR